MIGHGMMAAMMGLDGVNGFVLLMTGHGTTMRGMTGHGMMDGMKVLTGVGKVGMKVNKALLQAVDCRLLSRVFSRLTHQQVAAFVTDPSPEIVSSTRMFLRMILDLVQ